VSTLEPLGLLIAVVSGVLTFLLARWLGKGFRERRAARLAQHTPVGQSRQVRRALARKRRG